MRYDCKKKTKKRYERLLILPESPGVAVAVGTFAGSAVNVAAQSVAGALGTAACLRCFSMWPPLLPPPPPFPAQLVLYCDVTLVVGCGGQSVGRQNTIGKIEIDAERYVVLRLESAKAFFSERAQFGMRDPSD